MGVWCHESTKIVKGTYLSKLEIHNVPETAENNRT